MTEKKEAFDRAVAAAMAHLKVGETRKAEAAYRVALSHAPGHPAILHNLGVLVARRGDHQGALECFDAAVAAEPRYASAHYNRAVAQAALGQNRQAIESFLRVTVLDPDHYAAHRALGFCWLAAGDRGRALDHFARTYDLRRGDDRSGIALKSLTQANRTKLLHDAEQFRYLAGLGRDAARYEGLARAYQAVAANFPDAVTPLADDAFELLGDNYNSAIHISDAPEIPDGAVAPRPDRDSLVAGLHENGAVFFDDLLTPPALERLRAHLLESTIWHDFSHIGGLVASYLEDGLASPLLLQIADELRRAFPDLLLAHPLSQAWAFKGVTKNALIDVHADDAVYSFNFWITPARANLEPSSGGMKICLQPPPEDWTVEGYDSGIERAVHFLEQHQKKMFVIPYGENRAVLFKSRLLHLSDAPVFDQAYENSRINITLLFGVNCN